MPNSSDLSFGTNCSHYQSRDIIPLSLFRYRPDSISEHFDIRYKYFSFINVPIHCHDDNRDHVRDCICFSRLVCVLVYVYVHVYIHVIQTWKWT
jgi:hypothetical protein